MASRQHDFLIQMIMIKMQSLGFEVIASDSHYYKSISSRIPPTIVTHRPDCIGFRQEDSSICIGEAKYSGDLLSSRTKKQLHDFVELCSLNEKYHCIVAIPSKECARLKKE